MIVRGFYVIAMLAVIGLAAAPSMAQTNQPIYPVYDGYLVTEDGIHVIAYAYFSHNHETVTVALGTANAVSPAPADRLQPTTFRPGHHRFQCVMVVGADFTGGLRWTLSYAGTTTSTSDNMLQYNWELDDRTKQQVLRDVDVATAPQDVCLNRSPIVRLLGLRGGPEGAPPEVSAAVGGELRLFGSVLDEGLPRGGTLTTDWRMISGPGTVIFSAPNEPRTLAAFDRPGAYELELWATDSELDTSTRVIVNVEAAP